jgi:hypothetical protein
MSRWAARLLSIALILSPSLAMAAPRATSAKPEPPPPAPVEDTPAQRAAKLRDQGNDAMLGMRYADALGAYSKALYAEIRPRVSLLDLTCDVAGARVLVRDKVIGVTPLPPTRILAGAVTLAGGGELSLKVPLHAKSTSGFVSITTNPMGALVSVDGSERGTSTPKLELALPAGPHDVSVKRDGYDAARIPIVLSPGSSRDVSTPLEPTRSERGADHGSLTPGQVSGP